MTCARILSERLFRTSPSDAPTLRRAAARSAPHAWRVVVLTLGLGLDLSLARGSPVQDIPVVAPGRVTVGLGLESGLGLGIGIGLEEGPVVAPLLARLGGGGEAHVLLGLGLGSG